MRSNFPVGFVKRPDRGVDHCSRTQELFLSFFPDQEGHSRLQLLSVGVLCAVLKIFFSIPGVQTLLCLVVMGRMNI